VSYCELGYDPLLDGRRLNIQASFRRLGPVFMVKAKQQIGLYL